MGDLVRTLIVCGVLSGTQPVTIMGLLLVMTGERPRANGWAFVAGAFAVETALLLVASFVAGATVDGESTAGHTFLAVRAVLGVVLVGVGLYLRRPPAKEVPDVPASLARLRDLAPGKAFGAGMVLADYQGPVVGSLAIAAADVQMGGRLVALVPYTLLATGIPVAVILATTRSAALHDRLEDGTTWVMRNRRRLASIVLIAMGLFLVGDAALASLATA